MLQASNVDKNKLSIINKRPEGHDICACLAVRKAARAITQFYDTFIQDSGLKPTQHSLLMAAYIADGVTISDLATFMVMDRTTLTRNLKPLEKEGYLSVSPGDDRRTKLITVTRKGAALLRKMMPDWEKAQQELIKRLGEKKYSVILDDMARLVNITR